MGAWVFASTSSEQTGTNQTVLKIAPEFHFVHNGYFAATAFRECLIRDYWWWGTGWLLECCCWLRRRRR